MLIRPHAFADVNERTWYHATRDPRRRRGSRPHRRRRHGRRGAAPRRPRRVLVRGGPPGRRRSGGRARLPPELRHVGPPGLRGPRAGPGHRGSPAFLSHHVRQRPAVRDLVGRAPVLGQHPALGAALLRARPPVRPAARRARGEPERAGLGRPAPRALRPVRALHRPAHSVHRVRPAQLRGGPDPDAPGPVLPGDRPRDGPVDLPDGGGGRRRLALAVGVGGGARRDRGPRRG